MAGRFFSDNAWIDIATNFTSFDAIDFSRDFGDFLDGNFKSGHLLTLLHEATHHWCLTTPVGTALAARSFRTYSDAAHAAHMLRRGQEVPDETADVLRQSILTGQVLTGFFVPLLEGLALYAEWRAGPSTGGTYSRPFDIYAKFSGASQTVGGESEVYRDLRGALSGKSAQARADILQAWIDSDLGRQADRQMVFRLNIELRHLRSRHSERRRFRHVLSSPVDPRASSYQLGYLFVCALERLCWGAENTDRFMAYLREYFLHDHDLASAILSDQIAPDDLYSLVRQSLQSKVNGLVQSTDGAAERLQTWGDSIPKAAFENKTIGDFFGQTGTSGNYEFPSGDDPAREAFVASLEAFCEAAGSETVPPAMLLNFLSAGRVLMPLGSRNFTVTSATGERLELRSEYGVELSLFAGEFVHRPPEGATVVVSMLVNVASPGAAVSVAWGESFEVVSLVEDEISKAIIEGVYHAAEQIRLVVSTGQNLIKSLSIGGENERQPIEYLADQFLNSDSVTLDIVQIYRAAIAPAFALDPPRIMTPAWRQQVFSFFEPNGVHTLLSDPVDMDLFLQICGMPFGHYVSSERLRAVGVEGSDAELDRMVSDSFKQINGVSEIDLDRAVHRLKPVFERAGLSIFSETSFGWGSAL